MFRLSIPLALLIGIGVAARLTSQENLAPDSDRDEIAAELVVEAAREADDAEFKFDLVTEVNEEIRNEVKQAEPSAGKPEVRDVDVELEFMLSQAEGSAGTQPSADARSSFEWQASGATAEAPGGTADARMIRIYPLEHAEAEAAAEVIDRLFQDVVGLVTHADRRTNSLIVRATPSHQEQIGAFIQALDKAPSQEGQSRRMRLRVHPGGSPAPPGDVAPRFRARARVEDEDEIVVERLPAAGVPLLVPPSGDRDVLIFNNRQDMVARVMPLEGDQHELAVLAERIRALRAVAPPDEEAIADLEAQLRERVVAAFEARQAAQRAELAVLEQQLQSIKQDIERRDRQKDDLVKQRLEQWLSGNRKRR